jgi:hypothetical protein
MSLGDARKCRSSRFGLLQPASLRASAPATSDSSRESSTRPRGWPYLCSSIEACRSCWAPILRAPDDPTRGKVSPRRSPSRESRSCWTTSSLDSSRSFAGRRRRRGRPTTRARPGVARVEHPDGPPIRVGRCAPCARLDPDGRGNPALGRRRSARAAPQFRARERNLAPAFLTGPSSDRPKKRAGQVARSITSRRPAIPSPFRPRCLAGRAPDTSAGVLWRRRSSSD